MQRLRLGPDIKARMCRATCQRELGDEAGAQEDAVPACRQDLIGADHLDEEPLMKPVRVQLKRENGVRLSNSSH